MNDVPGDPVSLCVSGACPQEHMMLGIIGVLPGYLSTAFVLTHPDDSVAIPAVNEGGQGPYALAGHPENLRVIVLARLGGRAEVTQ